MRTVKDALGAGEKFGLLDSFGQSDFVSVVTFSQEASVVGSSELLVRGTADNLKELKRAVNLLVEKTTTNFQAGFEKAFDVLRESDANERTSSCKRVIVFLTDGEDSECNLIQDGGATSCGESYMENGACRCGQRYLEQIDQWQEKLVEDAGGAPAAIFAYSMGAEAGNMLPRQIACRNGGSWGEIGDGEDPLSQMQAFFSFLAKDAQPNTVYWSEPFNDWSQSRSTPDPRGVSSCVHR